MDKFYLRAIRVAAKNKLPDRWIHSQWYQPLDAEDAGTTFVLIEVVNPWFPAPQITATITNTFNREYFRQRRMSSATDSFEVAVRRVNEALAARAEEGETDWIGNLHAQLAVIAGNEIHYVQTGKAVGLIFRNNTISPLAEPRHLNDTSSPINTFVNIAAGTLEPGDKGVFATPDLTKYLDHGQLTAALANPLDGSAREIVKRLQEQRIKTPHAVLYDFSGTPHPERKPNEPDTIFIDVPLIGGFARVKHLAKETVLPVLSQGMKATGSAAAWFWGKTRSDFFPRLKSGISIVAKRGREKVAMVAQKSSPVIETVGQKTEEAFTSVSMQSESVDHHPIITSPASLLARLLNGLTRLTKAIRLRGRLALFALAIIFIAVVGIRYFTFSRQGETKAQREQAQQDLSLAQSKKQEGDLAVIYKEDDQAIDAFIQALTLARKAKESPTIGSTADDVINAAQSSLDSLTNTIRLINLNKVVTYPSESTAFASVGENLWAVDEAGTVIAPLSQEIKLSGLGIILGMGFVSDIKRLYIVGQENIGMISTDSLTALMLDEPEGGWQRAKAIETYSTFLYFLDDEGGQIWKYLTSAEGVTNLPPAKYFAHVQNLTRAIDLAIDGNIYVLFADGQVSKYFKGATEAFSISGIPKPYEVLKEPRLIASDAAAAGVYVYDADGKRIVEFDKGGVYKRQFALPEAWDIKDMIVSAALKKLFVLAGKEVYEIGL